MLKTPDPYDLAFFLVWQVKHYYLRLEKAQKLSSDRTKSDEDDYEVYFWNQVLFQYIYGVAGPLNTYLVRNNNTAFNRHHIHFKDGIYTNKNVVLKFSAHDAFLE